MNSSNAGTPEMRLRVTLCWDRRTPLQTQYSTAATLSPRVIAAVAQRKPRYMSDMFGHLSLYRAPPPVAHRSINLRTLCSLQSDHVARFALVTYRLRGALFRGIERM